MRLCLLQVALRAGVLGVYGVNPGFLTIKLLRIRAMRKKLKTQRRILYAVVSLLPPFPPSFFAEMGISSSLPVAAPTACDAEIESAFADMFADAMERADWHGKRKPTWQQARDHFVVQMRAGGGGVA